MSDNAGTPEFSREIPLADIEAPPSAHRVEATPAERAALARRLALEDIPALACDFELRRLADQRTFEVTGRLEAEVVQECVVTLEPFANPVRERFAFRLAKFVDPAELDLDADDDTPEPLEGDRLDLGEIAAQQLALAIDPHPRKPGAEVPSEILTPAPDAAAPRAGPFAELAKLKDKA